MTSTPDQSKLLLVCHHTTPPLWQWSSSWVGLFDVLPFQCPGLQFMQGVVSSFSITASEIIEVITQECEASILQSREHSSIELGII